MHTLSNPTTSQHPHQLARKSSSSSSHLIHPPNLSQTGLDDYYKPDLITLSCVSHPKHKSHHLNPYGSFGLNPLSWYASNQYDDDRSLASPPPFSNLLKEQQSSNTEKPISTTEPVHHLQRNRSLPRRSFSNRQTKSPIVLHQQTTSELSLPPLSSRLSSGTFFLQHPSLSELGLGPLKPTRKRQSRPKPPRVHRMTIGSPIPDSLVHFQSPSTECFPNDRTSIRSHLPTKSRSSFLYNSPCLPLKTNQSTESIISGSKLIKNNRNVTLPIMNEKNSSLLTKVWYRIKNKARRLPNLNRRKQS
ncbi:hypothetical protein CROQUDRAFT_92403 [Cronartium quercuum f. sp. fusiforme G11]|uniref:Uncharacterized protein n=1 Tax=Cronartium quercuum f. sp. fusiforme G11 TaxID=708437 RepID=A0A9P6NM77_9BASI|nr:hypothetical protein CROQUDRAFT_92403 [Cronartium quercuum f. sp. fusiforme G11]